MQYGEVVETPKGLGRYIDHGVALVKDKEGVFHLAAASILQDATELTEKDIADLPTSSQMEVAKEKLDGTIRPWLLAKVKAGVYVGRWKQS